MAGFSRKDRENLEEFLRKFVDEEQLFMIAKALTKNTLPINDLNDAFEVIFLHGCDIRTILNKRHITKDILFRYLHDNKIAVHSAFTKHTLIESILQFWSERDPPASQNNNDHEPRAKSPSSQIVNHTENFPINLMARQFTQWFFERYNSNELTSADFWADASLQITIYLEDGIDERDASTSQEVVDALTTLKTESRLLFNACTLHKGCQGRIDVHGLVLVLACGTIHTPELCVGVFETVFSLARDPFAENNWKVKASQFVLRSKMNATASNYLVESESMRELLALPAPDGEF